MQDETPPPVGRVQRPMLRSDGSTFVVERRLTTAAVILVVALLAAASTIGSAAAVVAAGAAGLVMVLALAGRERTAVMAMMVAFATAPAYKGLAPSEEVPVTPTDLVFGLAVVLLLPTLLGRPLRLPTTYVVGVVIIVTTGTLSTLFSPEPVVSALQFVQWLVVVVGLVGLMAWWAPGWRMVDLLLWSYVVGHLVSTAYAPVGDAIGDRYLGLTHHPNAFGEAGVMAFAALMYLWRRNDRALYRAAVAVALAVSGASVIMSGSRAATVVVAGLIIMIPFVERSAWRGFLLAAGAALAIFALPLVLDSSGEGSALSRLAGTADALGADQARSDAQDFGIELFRASPFLGNGFADSIYVHNVTLAVVASIGLIGLVGYLLVLFTLARPIIGRHPQRRICYLAWAFIAITPTVPGLEDRTLWVPMAPVILVAVGMRAESLRAAFAAPRTHLPAPAAPAPALPTTETLP